MEQKNIFNTLKITPDYMILLYTKFLRGEENPDFTPMDYKKQIDEKTDINTIVEYLSNCGTREYDIWRDDENNTLTEKRAKILFRRITIKRLTEYLQDDPETTEKFRIQYLNGFRTERLKAMENYNNHFRHELKEKGKTLNKFMDKAFRKLHRKDRTEEQKNYYINNVRCIKPADKTIYEYNGTDRETKCGHEYEHLTETLEQWIKLHNRESIKCECGGSYSFKTRLKHVRSKIHQTYKAVN